MEHAPFSAPWVFQDYLLDHPGATAFVQDLVSAIAREELTRPTFDAIAGRHGVQDLNPFKGALLDLVLYYVRFALNDHALSETEIDTVRQLKRFLRIEDGDFWLYRREQVRDAVELEIARILVDGRIDRAEELHQVEVQALFDLGYDQYLALTKEVVAGAVEELETVAWLRTADDEMRKSRPPSVFLDWFLQHLPPGTSRAVAARTALAGLETVYRLQEYVDAGVGAAGEQPGRGIPQDVKDRVWRRDDGKCVVCGSQTNLEFDHIIPFVKGGASTYRNVQLLCETCNRQKSAQIG